jgi:quinol monooxygenase YgiN
MTGKVTVVARIKATKGKGSELAALLSEQAATVRAAEPGCLDYTPYRSVTDPDAFLFYEVYQDQSALDVHMHAPHLAAYRKKRQDLGLVAGPPEIQVFRSQSG